MAKKRSTSQQRKKSGKTLTIKQLRYISLALFIAAFLVRFIYLNQLQSMPNFDEPQMDERYHLEIANQINSEQGLPDEPFFRAPLYLYFFAEVFALTGSSFYWTRFIQILLASLIPVLILLLCNRLFNRDVALAASIITVFYPTLIYYDNSLLITSLMVLLTTALCWQLYRSERSPTVYNFIFAGVLLGLAGLARPNILLFGPALFIWVWFILKPKLGLRKALINYVIIGAACVLMILPVTIRNYVISGEFVPIAWQGGLNFFLGNNREATGWSATVSFIDPGWQGGYDESIAIAERELHRELPKSQVSDYWYDRASDEIFADPGHFAGLLFKKLRLFINGEEIPNNQNLYMVRDFVPLLRPLMFKNVLFFPYGLLAPLAIIGLAISITSWRKYLLIHLLLGSYLSSLLLFFLCARFRQPMIPLMIPFAVLAVQQMISFVRKKEVKKIAIAVVALTLLLVESNHAMLGTEHGGLESLDSYSLGIMYYDRGDLVNAQKYLLKSVEADPNFAKPYINLGLISRRSGDYEQALRYYQTAWELDPTAWRAYTNAAAILKRTDRLDEAIGLLEQARAAADYSEFVHLYLAQAYFEARRFDDAKVEIAEAVRINPNDASIQEAYRVIMSPRQPSLDR